MTDFRGWVGGPPVGRLGPPEKPSDVLPGGWSYGRGWGAVAGLLDAELAEVEGKDADAERERRSEATGLLSREGETHRAIDRALVQVRRAVGPADSEARGVSYGGTNLATTALVLRPGLRYTPWPPGLPAHFRHRETSTGKPGSK